MVKPIMDELHPYQTDHLFLLVGENPLPNYVAARLLRSAKTVLHLVHSTNTKLVAERLQSALGGRIETVSLDDQQADGFYIHKKILKHLEDLKKRRELNGAIGLHYTGGTKAMAVHAYRCLLNWQQKQGGSNPVLFSYLDPHQLQLCIDDHKAQSVQKLSVGVALDPPPALATILQLHGLQQKQEPDHQPTLPELAQALVRLHDREMRQFKQWSHQNFGQENAPTRKPFSEKKSPDDNWKEESQLKSCDLPIATLPESIKTLLCDHLDALLDSADPDRSILRLGISSAKANLRCSELCDWLCGTWLEHYVMSQMLELKDQYGLHDIVRSLKIENPNKKRGLPKFEFDVVFLRNYQLFGISCTTSDKHKTCKLKLFEAYSRAQQLGGNEVRVALVSTHEDPVNLRQELNLVRDDPKVLVIGKDDLKQVKIKLKDWICNTSKITK